MTLLVAVVLIMSVIGMATHSREVTYGYCDGDAFINFYTGYGCKLDKTWAVQAAESGKEENYEPYSDGEQMYVMDATCTNNGSRIAIGYVRLSVSERISMIYVQ